MEDTAPFGEVSNSGFHRSRSSSRSRSPSMSRSRSKSKSISRSKSESRSRSKSIRSMSRSQSRSRSRSNSKSQSISRFSSRSRSKSPSLEKSGSRSRSKSSLGSGVVSRNSSRSVSPPGSRGNTTLFASSSRSPSPETRSIKKRPRSASSESDRESPERHQEDKKSANVTSMSNLGLDVSSDDEDDPPPIQPSQGMKDSTRRMDDSDSDVDLVRRDRDSPVMRDSRMNDFDAMMQEKKEANKRYRKKKDIDVINENDDEIAKMIADMRIAAKEDRDLNLAEKPATKKMAMFPRVMRNLNKGELRLAFVEANLLSVMTDWLAPMPDKGLPHVNMRSAFLKLLQELKIEDPSRLKESGIGKAVMYLYRHPKETRENKVVAGHIINEWARPIFRKEDNLAHMTREERRERDDYLAKRREVKKKKKVEEVQEALKPGDPGWVSRARVPMPDAQEYIRRPEWQNSEQIGTVKKKTVSLLEKHKRKFAEKRRQSRNVSMTKISIEGARMGLGQDGLNVG